MERVLKNALALSSILIMIVGWAAPARSESPQQPGRYFAIQVIDERTGRGVPLVELKTVSNVAYYTDSLGLVAIDDPALMDRDIFFTIYSHGYEYPADGLGSRGTHLIPKAGTLARLKIKRVNIAERLYRITGEGIYEDSVRLGRMVPIEQPLLNGQVTGQDSAQTAVYHDKIFCFWGDTNCQSYPLGHFGTAGATAELPEKGGLDPSVGINFHYFTDSNGFSRPMVPPQPERLSWCDALSVLPDGVQERLVCRVSIMKKEECEARKLLIYNDAKNVFETLCDIPMDAPLQPLNHTLKVNVDGTDYLYCGEDFPNIRTKCDLEHFKNLASYEGFTCLKPGSRYDKSGSNLDCDQSGKLIWGWKVDTPPLGRRQVADLVSAGKIKANEQWFLPLDVETNKPLSMAASSVAYNEFRHEYVAIFGQADGGPSYLGEIWFSEADKPEGPWNYARKIVTHNRYSFYNPVHDAYYDQEHGKVIYFEGTYATTFSRNGDATPRYEYNQIMYRLDLSDPRLQLPH